MPFMEAVRLALGTIRVQKLKSFFTLIGVTIGVMFLITVVSIIEGMGKYMKEDLVGKLIAVNSFELRRAPNINMGEMSPATWDEYRRRPRLYISDLLPVVEALPEGTRWAQESEANVTLEDERLARALLRAPIDGRVLDRHVEPGEVVGAGAPVVTLADPRRPYADVFVPQGELAGIRVGARAELQVDAERTRFAGKVEHISRRTEFTPRYLFSERERPNLVVRVRVRIDDSGERLHAGVPAFVTIRREGAPGAKP